MRPRGVLIIAFELTIIMGNPWLPYDMYDRDFYQSQPYQGMGYSGGCASIIITGVPCQQPVRHWNLYPDYQPHYYNTRPIMPEMMPQIYAPYGGSMMAQNPGLLIDLLNRGAFPNSVEMPGLGGSMLSSRLQGANILNDKDKFEASGCLYDTTRGKCSDNLNLCKGRCKDFGGIAHDCRCIPESLLDRLGLSIIP